MTSIQVEGSGRRARTLPTLSVVLVAMLSVAPATARATEKTTVIVYPVTEAGPSPLLGPAEQSISASSRYRTLLIQAIAPLMRQHDGRTRSVERAAKLMETGRQALMSLDHDAAKTSFEQARELLEQSFVRYYDPQQLAEVHVGLGRLALQMVRPDLARQAFITALQLAPTLELDAYYSPQVRAAFSAAKQSLPPLFFPSEDELSRLAAFAHARYIVLLKDQHAGEQDVLQALVFRAQDRSLTPLDSKILSPKDREHWTAGALAIGQAARQAIEAELPKPRPRLVATSLPTTRPFTPPPPPKQTPWYLKWYTFAAAAVVVGACVAIPLSLRDEHVTMKASW